MASQYAGVLGLIAFAIVIVRSVILGSGVERTMEVGCFVLFIFAALGWVAGKLAERTVDEGLEVLMQQELARLDEQTEQSAAP